VLYLKRYFGVSSAAMLRKYKLLQIEAASKMRRSANSGKR
jgi:hypothetical protein